MAQHNNRSIVRELRDNAKKLTEADYNNIIPVPWNDYAFRGCSGATATPAAELLTSNEGSISCIVGHTGSGKTSFLYKILAEWTMKESEEDMCLYLNSKGIKETSCGEDPSSELHNVLKASTLYGDLGNDLLQEIVDTIFRTDGKGITILLDHFNIMDKTQLAKSIFLKLLSRTLLPLATIIVASTFNISDTLSDIMGNSPYNLYVLNGIKSGSEMDLLEHMREHYKADRVVEYIRYHCLELCSLPGMIAKLLVKFEDKPPTTYTEMIEVLIVETINEWLSNHMPLSSFGRVLSLSTLPHDLTDKLNLVCKLAYLSIESDSNHYSMSDLSKHVTFGGGSLEELDIGLLSLVRTDKKIYEFSHKIFREFLAAYYMASQPLLDQIRQFCRNTDTFLFDGKYSNFTKFYFGMSHILTKSLSASKKLTFESAFVLKPLLETVIGGELYIDEEQDIKSSKLKFVFQLLQECQDTNLVHKFLNRREKYLDLVLNSSAISDPLVVNLAFVMGHSGISKWSIEASESKIHSADYIAMLVQAQSSQKIDVQVYTDSTSRSNVFAVRARVQGGVQAKKLPPSTAYVRCMREVLHRVLQLYSPVKLKSNSTEPSYVSFLVCECLKDKIEKEQMLAIEPINAMHWITVKMKTKEKASGSKTTSDETELRHMARHNMEQLELVLMMSPLPHRIRYKDPSDNDTVETIYLSRSSSPHFLDGKIATSLRDHLRGDEAVDVGVMETQSGNSLSECVTLPFIIPSSFKDIMGHVVLFSSIAETYSICAAETTEKSEQKSEAVATHVQSENKTLFQVAETSQEEVTHYAKSGHNSSKELQVNLPQSGASVVDSSHHANDHIAANFQQGVRHGVQASAGAQPSLHPATQHDFGVQASAGAQPSLHPTTQHGYFGSIPQQSLQPISHQGYQTNTQSSSSTLRQSLQPSVQQSLPGNTQKQIASPPGTVLHTTDPLAFTVDNVYSLPEENILLKKGGNGSVFAVNYGGKEYAVKKTAYRSKEFQIHKKLKHVNIIELSCFMFGTQQPLQRRRYFCYHFMPRVTGDLARMVTDKSDLTMHSLSSKYENDPRKLGSMRGNWKYILKELLKGLAYMHSMNIVHRDMKASNVLINMLCSCDNPLTCICSQKCSVRISDFDAALELDSSGSLQPSPNKTQQNSGSGGVYQIMPVGTDGYRSPETSQLTLSNDLSVIRPALTVKSDIWSVGLILLRMLNGSNGPTRQQKLSTLLLYYEQEKCREDAKRKPRLPKFMQIHTSQVERIIGLHQFSQVSNSWIAKAVECIATCVKVDPNKRPTARELLDHPFLY